jgi:hypothetical protein
MTALLKITHAVSADKFFLYGRCVARLRHTPDIAKLAEEIIPPEQCGQPECVGAIARRIVAGIQVVPDA